MKKFLVLLFAMIMAVGSISFTAFADGEKLENFTDDFESYEANGQYIESDSALTTKWDNNVFRGGEALGMDSHIVNIGKIEYENGQSGNKVLHLQNQVGANTFFYMGPSGDYRVKNFTAEFKVKFLVKGVPERSWIGLSFRKKVNSHYTGTNNLMFVIQRFAEATQITGHAYSIMNSSLADLADPSVQMLYGDKISIERENYAVPGAVAGEDMDWITYKLKAENNTYTIYVNDTVVTTCTFNVNSFDYFGYLSLNCCTSNVMVDDFKVTVDDETAPPEILPLGTPTLSVDTENQKVTWTEVADATTYKVVYGEGEEDYAIVFNKTEWKYGKLKPGTHKITVSALSDDTFLNLDGLPSNEVEVTIEGDVESVTSEEGKKKGCKGSLGGTAMLCMLAGLAACTLKRKGE